MFLPDVWRSLLSVVLLLLIPLANATLIATAVVERIPAHFARNGHLRPLVAVISIGTAGNRYARALHRILRKLATGALTAGVSAHITRAAHRSKGQRSKPSSKTTSNKALYSNAPISQRRPRSAPRWSIDSGARFWS